MNFKNERWLCEHWAVSIHALIDTKLVLKKTIRSKVEIQLERIFSLERIRFFITFGHGLYYSLLKLWVGGGSKYEKHWQSASGVHHPRLLDFLQRFLQKSMQFAILILSLAENRRKRMKSFTGIEMQENWPKTCINNIYLAAVQRPKEMPTLWNSLFYSKIQCKCTIWDLFIRVKIQCAKFCDDKALFRMISLQIPYESTTSWNIFRLTVHLSSPSHVISITNCHFFREYLSSKFWSVWMKLFVLHWNQ